MGWKGSGERWGTGFVCPASAGSSVCGCRVVISGVVPWLGTSSRKYWHNLGSWQLGATEEIKGLNVFANWRIIASRSRNVAWQGSRAVGSFWWQRGEYVVLWGPICNTALGSRSLWPSPCSACVTGFRKAVRGETAYFIKGHWNCGCVLVSCAQAGRYCSCCLQLESKQQGGEKSLWAGGPCNPSMKKLKMELTTTRGARP